MRWIAIMVLLFAAPASAQVELAPNQMARVVREFDSHPGDTPLRCEVTVLAPVPNFAFRFQAGYIYHVPQAQYPGPVQGWSELTELTPEDGSGKLTYLLSRHPFAEASKSDLTFDLQGLYQLGEGGYSVKSAIRDDRNRVCRKQWHILVRAAHGDRLIPSALPPFAIRPISVMSWPDTRHIDNAAPIHMSVLLNAAAFSPRRATIRPSDRLVLVEALTAMLEHLPAASVRLVVFSLEQQRELFRSDAFALSAIPKVADAIAGVQVATVDVHLLQQPLGHINFLEQMINGELTADTPVDTVVFLGPPSRYANKIPAGALRIPAFAHPRFFYLQYQGPRRLILPSNSMDTPLPAIGAAGRVSQGMPQAPGTGSDPNDPMSASTGQPPAPPRLPPPTAGSSNSDSNGGTGSGGTPSTGAGGGGSGGRGVRSGAGRGMPPMPGATEHDTDIINAAVARLKGKTLAIHTPAELAKAIRKIERRK